MKAVYPNRAIGFGFGFATRVFSRIRIRAEIEAFDCVLETFLLAFRSFRFQRSFNIWNMIRIRKENVPQYLHGSQFYGSLSDEPGEWFDIPAGTLKANMEVRTEKDLTELLSTMRFWGATCEPSFSAVAYILASGDLDAGFFEAEFSRDIPMLAALLNIRSHTSTVGKLFGAVELGHLSVLHFFRDDLQSTPLDFIALAARYGYLQCCEYLFNLGKPLITSAACKEAAAAGHEDVLAFLFDHGFPMDSGVCREAARGGHLNCLQYAQEHGCPWDRLTCKYAAQAGQLTCLQYAMEHNCPCDQEGLGYWAALGGSVAVLQYVHQRGCVLDERICSAAARHGHLGCLQYAREHHCPWNSDTCDAAASGGHIECLRYAITHGCPMSHSLCTTAAESGHLQCLILARKYGAVWHDETSMSIAHAGHLDCFQYAAANGCAMRYDWCVAVAARRGHVHILRFIFEQTRKDMNIACSQGAMWGQLQCLRFGHERGGVINDQCAQYAWSQRHYSCLKYIIEQCACLAGDDAYRGYFKHCAPTRYHAVLQRLRWLVACYPGVLLLAALCLANLAVGLNKEDQFVPGGP